VVVNPLVPYVNDFEKQIPTVTGSRARHVSDMGFPQIGYQAFSCWRISVYTRLLGAGRNATRASTSS
jgi:hypothetical protein